MEFRRILPLTVFMVISFSVSAQKKWNLRTVVEHAMANNINVRLTDVQARIAAVNLKQNNLSQIPSLNLSANSSYNSGNSQDPTTFVRTTESFIGGNVQLQSSADIFNFFSKQHTIAASRWELAAAKASIEKAKNDIALTAANAYLQVLLALENRKITAVQVDQTTAQLNIVRKQVEAGSIPPLNAAQLEAQLSIDSVNYITATGNVDQSILLLKSYMNIDAAEPFDVEAPPADKIPVEPIADLQPEAVYQIALLNQPQQKVNDYRLKAAERSVKAASASRLPVLSVFGSLVSTYNNKAIDFIGYNPIYVDTIPVGIATVNGTSVNVFPYKADALTRKTSFSTQLSNNFRQAIGLNLSVPIFNGWNAKANLERNRLNVESIRLQKLQDDQKLKQDIYQAYNSAVVAMKKFEAGSKSVEVNELAFDYANRRFGVGMLSTFELITTQNNLLRARLEYVLNQFDYVFKMKVLEFYKGQGLKL